MLANTHDDGGNFADDPHMSCGHVLIPQNATRADERAHDISAYAGYSSIPLSVKELSYVFRRNYHIF